MTQKDSKLQLDARSLPPPTWKTQFGFGFIFRQILDKLVFNIMYRRDVAQYLRSLGAKVGVNSILMNRVSAYGSEPWLIEIGNRVTVSSGVVFITHDGASRIIRHLIPNSSQYGNLFGTISILDNCFIGVNSILLPRIHIGPNSIVGAGSVVNSDVPPETVYAGVPARCICPLEEYVKKYKNQMVPVSASNLEDLRRELTLTLWGEIR